MSKNLKFIQVVSKIGYVISYIVFVCAIIGAAATALMALLFGMLLSISTPEINGIVSITGLDVFTFFSSCLLLCFACAGNIVLGFMGKKYFKFQCEAGTPFTYEGAKKLLKLGIADVIVTGSIIIFEGVLTIVYAMFELTTGEVVYSFDFTLGLIFIFLSFVFKYGAELAEAKKEEPIAFSPVVDEVADEKEETVENSTEIE